MHLRKDHAEAFVDSGEYREFTRLYRSGQFIFATALREAFVDGPMREAREIRRFSNPRGSIEPSGGINIVRMMRLVSVAYLNASLLIEKLKLSEPIELSLKLGNVKGHVLVAGPQRELDEYYQALNDSIEVDQKHIPEDVRVKPLELALSAACDIFAMFGWTEPLHIVVDGIQEQALI